MQYYSDSRPDRRVPIARQNRRGRYNIRPADILGLSTRYPTVDFGRLPPFRLSPPLQAIA